MQSSENYKPNQSRGVLILGHPGSGKTTIGLQVFPRTWVADLDNNLAGAERFLRGKSQFLYDTTDFVDGDKPVEPAMRFSHLSECIKRASTHVDVQSLGIDSFTKLSDYIIDHILKTQGRQVMQLQDWGTYLGLMKSTITRMRSTRKLFWATAHIKPEKDEVSGIIRYFPALPGQIQHIIGALFSDVWLCEVQEKQGVHKFLVRTMPNTFYPLKNSLGLPPITDADTIRVALESEETLNG